MYAHTLSPGQFGGCRSNCFRRDNALTGRQDGQTNEIDISCIKYKVIITTTIIIICDIFFFISKFSFSSVVVPTLGVDFVIPRTRLQDEAIVLECPLPGGEVSWESRGVGLPLDHISFTCSNNSTLVFRSGGGNAIRNDVIDCFTPNFFGTILLFISRELACVQASSAINRLQFVSACHGCVCLLWVCVARDNRDCVLLGIAVGV